MFGFSTFAQTPFAALSGAIVEGQAAIDAIASVAVSANITAAGAAQIDGVADLAAAAQDRKSTRLNSSHVSESRMPSSA